MTILALLLAAAPLQAASPPSAMSPSVDTAVSCSNCEEWNRPQTPFKLHGRSYYVGPQGLSAILIQTSDGLILLDGGLPQSALLIEANIKSLGFKVEDIKLIVNSHAHYDHAGGIARLQRDSGAVVAASARGAQGLMAGMAVPDDPQFGKDGKDTLFPAVPKVRVIKDREELRVGDTLLTAHFTPGHTPGSTTWTWLSCEGTTCLNLVYADSLTAVSSGDFRFLGDQAHPGVSEVLRRSIDTIAALPCDLMVSTHPGASGLFERLKLRAAGSRPDPLIDQGSCRAYANNAGRGLDQRLKAERASATK